MGEKLVIGPINKGLRTDREPFVIDNDSFPTLINAYQWRGRIKRKRGTQFLTHLNRFYNSANSSYNPTVITIVVDGGTGMANLITGYSLQANGSIVPGTVTITDTISGQVYTDPTEDGYLTPSGTGGPNTINYATGLITIPAAKGHAILSSFYYYPDLPVMGLEDLILEVNQFPGTLAFDTTYSYNINTAFPYSNYDVSFFKNPATGSYPGYIQKTNETAVTWNGQDYQQFWTVNYQGALFATNGINIPFSTTNIGMPFKPITGVLVTSVGPPAIATITIVAHGLSVGDFVFINEVNGFMTGTPAFSSINMQTGYVIAIIDANTVSVEFPNATLLGAYISGGIAQYLTNRSDPTKDCIRWYDGDPTNGSFTAPVLNGVKGWVNFCPPLSKTPFSIGDLPLAIYYLVGARLIVPFKDRLMFLGPVIQSQGSGPFYLQDTIVYSQNGTAFYTASFTGDPSLADTLFAPILVPINQTATAPAFWEDQTGFGGFITFGVDNPIISASPNKDVLIVGFDRFQSRMVYTGNDLVPFNLFTINSEYGTSSTFSAITMDEGVLSRGNRGFVITGQTDCARIDLPIPDEAFELQLTHNGTERVTSQRDFINEWVYFTYPPNNENEADGTANIYPCKTLQYNYRDQSWATFIETYTTYGTFRKQTSFTWATVGDVFPSWEQWNEPWNTGSSTLLNPKVIGGNQQGFVLERDDGTGEGTSLYIKSFSGNTITSPAHCLNPGDYIIISGATGDIGAQVNGLTFQVATIPTLDTFTITPAITSASYFGLGLITRIYIPMILTKQFPTAWGFGRKTRIGMQQYLLTTTAQSQIQLLIFLSQDASNAYNDGTIYPNPLTENNSLIYSSVLYTCPESTNLGLTPANVNLQMPTAATQAQIWHRINTSLIGDTVQLGFTMTDAQIRELLVDGIPFAITGASQAIQCVLTCAGAFEIGQLIQIAGVVGMTQLNGNIYQVVVSDSTTVTINVDSTGFTAYVSGGTATPVANINAFAEIELHSIVMDVSPSQLLA